MKRIEKTGSQRGFVLLLALLLMLALTGIALVALRATTSNITFAGAQRISAMAQSVTTSGVEGTLVFAAMNPAGYTDYITANNGVVSMTDFSASFFDTAVDGTGSFGREAVNVNSVFWQSRMVHAQASARAPGYQLGQHCFMKYTSFTDGAYQNQGNTLDPNDIKRNMERNAMARDLTTLYVGPINCP